MMTTKSNNHFPLSLETMDGRDLIVDLARPDERQEIYDFLLVNFIPVPPIRQLSQYDDGPEEFKRPAWVLEYVGECISQPYSLLARNKDGTLVAVMLNILESRKEEEEHSPYWDWNLTTAYMAALYKNLDLFTILECDQIFHLTIVSVSPNYAKQGLATKLYQLSLDLIAPTTGAGGVKTEAGSIYVARLATKLGFNTYKTLEFASIEYEGRFPLANKEGIEEHSTARLMARRLAQ